MIRRREVVIALGGAAFARPLAALGQVSPRRAFVAWLSGTSQTLSSPFVASFLQGMQELGYVEGRNLDMLYRFSEGLQDKLAALAVEVVRQKPDVILAAAAITRRPQSRSSARPSPTRFTSASLRARRGPVAMSRG
jgi:putative ABC transport system substrate-binding protein